MIYRPIGFPTFFYVPNGFVDRWSSMSREEMLVEVSRMGFDILQSEHHHMLRQVVAGFCFTEEEWVAAEARKRLGVDE